MAYIIVGLGNPGKEYEKTRHNAGRLLVEKFAKDEGFDDLSAGWRINKKANALVTEGKVEGEKVTLVLPETMMNLCGKAVMQFIKTPKAAKNLLVVQDDLDLPLGVTKMVVGRGSGGHKGIESIMRAIKTKDFARLRIGISATGKKNQAKKVSGDEKVIKHVIGKFKPAEDATLKKVLKKGIEATRLFVTQDVESATQFANTR